MIDQAVEHLQRAGVVAAATESFFGLLADATRADAVDALLRLKPRGADKGVPLIVPSREVWEQLVVALPEVARRLGEALWPGPLTIALTASAAVDPRLLLDGRVAVRLPGPCAAAELAARFKGPLTATSANFPGMSPATTDAEVRAAFPNAVGALRICPGAAPGGVPSTVVVVEGNAVHVVRVGAISEGRVRAAARG
jgi:L-threonylcarbamoyladenylate synthase